MTIAAAVGAGSPAERATRTTYTTKEWVIPARPKPGRKPKPKPEVKKPAKAQHADAPSPSESIGSTPDAGPSSRPTQKAFRERKQDYLASLEVRVKQLEADEGEKAVLFQRQAVRYKAEMEEALRARDGAERVRDELQRENKLLRKELTKATGSVNSVGGGERADDEDEAEQLKEENESLRSHADALRLEIGRLSRLVRGYQEADEPRLAKRPRAVSPAARPTTIDPSATSVKLQLPRQGGLKQPVWSFAPAVPSAVRTGAEDGEPTCSGDPANCPACRDDPFGRAFCSALSANVCSTNPCADCPNSAQNGPPSPHSTTSAGPTSTGFTTTAHAAGTTATATMEVDPVDEYTAIPCCGRPELCGSATCGPSEIAEASPTPCVPRSSSPPAASSSSSSSDPIAPPLVGPDGGGGGGGAGTEAMPCSDAWRKLKSHPNIGFANLQLLADVVSRRTRCEGPLSQPASSRAIRPSPLRSQLTPPPPPLLAHPSSSSYRSSISQDPPSADGPARTVVKMEDVEHHHLPTGPSSSTAIWAAAAASSSSTTSSSNDDRFGRGGRGPHDTLFAAYAGAEAQGAVGGMREGDQTLTTVQTKGGRRLTVDRRAVDEALAILDRAGGRPSL